MVHKYFLVTILKVYVLNFEQMINNFFSETILSGPSV